MRIIIIILIYEWIHQKNKKIDDIIFIIIYIKTPQQRRIRNDMNKTENYFFKKYDDNVKILITNYMIVMWNPFVMIQNKKGSNKMLNNMVILQLKKNINRLKRHRKNKRWNSFTKKRK